VKNHEQVSVVVRQMAVIKSEVRITVRVWYRRMRVNKIRSYSCSCQLKISLN